MTGPLIAVYAVVIGLAVWGMWVLQKKQRAAAATVLRERQARADDANKQTRQFEADVRQFAEQQSKAWPASHVLFASADMRRYLMLSADQRCLRVATLAMNRRPSDPLVTDVLIDLGDVVSVELQQDSETITRLETSVETQKKSGLGRAVVGGALLGGIGAIVGATTAGSTTKASSVSTIETRKGPIHLVIGTTSITQPLFKFQMGSIGTAEVWLHRLRAGLAIVARQEQMVRLANDTAETKPAPGEATS